MTLQDELRSPLAAFERSADLSLVRAQALCTEAADALDALELRARQAEHERDAMLEQLQALTVDRDDLAKRLDFACTGLTVVERRRDNLLHERDALRERVAELESHVELIAINRRLANEPDWKARAEADAKDAARYRWLRERIEVRNLSSVAGTIKPAISVRIGCAFIEGGISRTKRLNHPDWHEEVSTKLDAAIDAAMKEQP